MWRTLPTSQRRSRGSRSAGCGLSAARHHPISMTVRPILAFFSMRVLHGAAHAPYAQVSAAASGSGAAGDLLGLNSSRQGAAALVVLSGAASLSGWLPYLFTHVHVRGRSPRRPRHELCPFPL